MIIKSNGISFKYYLNRAKQISSFLLRKKTLSFTIFFFFLIVVAFTTSISLITYGALLHKKHYLQGFEQTFHYINATHVRIPFNYLHGLLAKGTPRLYIDIDYKNLKRLSYFREIAFFEDSISEKQFLSCEIRYNGHTYKAKVKLTGYLNDNIASDKWSLRIKLSDDKTLFGLNEFNLLHPKIRYGIYEWVCHQLETHENLISLRTNFVDVTINGKNKGVYYLEERFNKTAIEYNRMREGIIFKPLDPLTILKKKRMMAIQNGTAEIAVLHEMLDSFLKGHINASDIFDIDKMAKYYAITDLANGLHQLLPGNTHFYLNPITQLIEPIGREWDVHFYRKPTSLSGECIHDYIKNTIHREIFKDTLLFIKYIETLNRISRKEYLDEFFTKIEPALKKNMNILYKNYPFYHFSKDYFYDNQLFIRSKLNRHSFLNAYYSNNNNDSSFQLFIKNQSHLPVKLYSLLCTTNDTVSEINVKDHAIIYKSALPTPEHFTPVQLTLPLLQQAIDTNKLMVIYSILGSHHRDTIDAFPWIFNDITNRYAYYTARQPNIKEHDFINVNDSDRIILFKKGIVKIKKDVIIPKGFTVIATSGSTYDLVNNAKIISQSPFKFIGVNDAPITISSSDSTGKGIFIHSTEKKSIFINVRFDNLQHFTENSLTLTGAVVFYEADVDFDRCLFEKNRSGDDYLNIVRSQFTITNTCFNKTVADAFDADFSSGLITHSSFINCGNDGIDVSGTTLTLNYTRLDTIGDKGISAGENSSISMHDCLISNAEISVCSKDLSSIKLQNVSILKSTIGLCAFQKKSEFGPGTINFSKSDMVNIAIPYLIEKNSNCIINGKQFILSNQDSNVKNMLYGVKYGKKS